jgi:GBP family porin
MRKTWVALAVLGAFAGVAQAQSSVTLYGIVDVNYMWQELPTAVGSTVTQESKSSINSGHQSGSRWGMRGSEDLGGGLKAIFTLEGGYSPDTGTLGQSGRIFGRQAWAGLEGGWGKVVAGRIATFSSGTGSFYMTGNVDPFSTGFGLAGLGNTMYSMNALRLDNSVAYQTPKWGGFQFGAGYSLNANGNEAAPSNKNTDVLFLGANWQGGPFFVMVTYDTADGGSGSPDQKHLQVGGTFDIGPFRLHAAYADQSNIGTVPAIGQGGSGAFVNLPAGIKSFDTNAYMLGATWNLGAFSVFGSWQMQDADSKPIAGTNANFDPDFNIWALGGTWNLSRRTNLYVSYASRNADGSLIDNSFNGKELALGMRHLF